MVDKVILYDQHVVDESDYLSNLLAIADNRDAGGYFCDSMKAIIDDPYYVNWEYDFTGSINLYCLDDYDLDKVTMRADIFADLSASSEDGAAGIVTYRGHGGRTQLGGIINTDEHLDQFTNTGQPFLWLSGDSLDGDFSHPHPERKAMSEQLMRLDNLEGAAGYWASSGLGFDREYTGLYQGFYEGIYQAGIYRYRVGDGIVYAKGRYLSEYLGNEVVVWAFNYQGDPAMLMPNAWLPDLYPTPIYPIHVPTATPRPTTVDISSPDASVGGGVGMILLIAAILITTITSLFVLSRKD